jgi:outer membrane protein assembly factor BamB
VPLISDLVRHVLPLTLLATLLAPQTPTAAPTTLPAPIGGSFGVRAVGGEATAVAVGGHGFPAPGPAPAGGAPDRVAAFGGGHGFSAAGSSTVGGAPERVAAFGGGHGFSVVGSSSLGGGARPAGQNGDGDGYGSSADSDWRQNGADAGRSGHQELTGALDAPAARHLRQAWTAPATRENERIGGAVVVDGTVLRSADAAAGAGQIRRYDGVTGGDRGPLVDAPGRAFGQLAAAGNALVVESIERPSVRRYLGAYRMSGQPEWETELPDEVSGGFTVGDGLILRSAGSTLSAYRVTDGAVAWSVPLGAEPGLHPPVVAGGLVLQATEPGRIAAYDERSGTSAWTHDAPGAELVAFGDAVFAVGERGVCAYAVHDGARRWCDAEALDSPVYASAAPGALYVIDGHGGLAAFDAGSGAVRWRTSYGLDSEVDASYWSPVNGGGVVYAVVYHFGFRGGVSTHRVELIAADAATGELLRRLDLDVVAMVGGEPLLLSGDYVYFAALAKLYAFAA